MHRKVLTVGTLLAIISHLSVEEHIVFIQTCASYSHRIAHWPLVTALAAKGHNVTFISPFTPKLPTDLPNVKDIFPKGLQDFMNDCMARDFDVNHRAYGLVPPLFAVMNLLCYQACEALHKSDEFQEWISSTEGIDLVISDVMAECSIGLVEKFKSKNIIYSPIALINKHFEPYGINPDSSSVPDHDFPGPFPLSFLTRVMLYLLPFFNCMMDHIFYGKYLELFRQELNVTITSSTTEFRDLQSLIIINGDYISDYPRSFPPFVIKVPGIHLKAEVSKLPKEIEDFINIKNCNGSAVDGFVYISFGTVVKPSKLPMDVRKAFFKVFQRFPNLRFIWRWDQDKPASYPVNVLFAGWIEQQSILAHPKIRAFLTQAGRPSIQEAIHYSVPMITFPVVADQDMNARRMEMLGVSINLDFAGLTGKKLATSLSKILTDKRYMKRIKQLKGLVEDVPMDPVRTAVWWTEFVMRHTKEELLLMKPLARYLAWYEKRDLDVISFVILMIVILSYIMFASVRAVTQSCIKQKEKTS